MLILITVLLLNIAFIFCLILGSEETEEEAPEIFEIEATAYCCGTTTATGSKVREGIIAGRPEWFGKVAAIYKSDGGKIGDFIGYFEVLDTGGTAIKNGRVIDIYNPSKEWCLQFGRQRVFITLIDGKG